MREDEHKRCVTKELPDGVRRLLLVSNRGPLEYSTDARGALCREQACGGVATALTAVAQSVPVTWIACAASDEDRALAARGTPVALPGGSLLRLVAPPEDAYALSYNTFCNPILWFLQHGIWDQLHRPDPEQEAIHSWEHGYLPVNQAVAEAVVDELRRHAEPPVVMLHDYHLYLAPLLIRDAVPRANLQHFVHIPWPQPEAWRRLPEYLVMSICEGLLANDRVGFQTRTSARNFLLTCNAFLPDVGTDLAAGTVERRGRTTLVQANPISVHIASLQAHAASPKAQDHRRRLALELGERAIVRIDRLDPSKNIIAGFRAFDSLLQEHPSWIGRVRFTAFLVPSRTGIEEYRRYAGEVFALVREINDRYGTAEWTPINIHYEHNYLQALAAMTLYDVLLVNPIRDGMNLVSKEGPVVNTKDGVLVLSEGAGSMAELRDGALAVEADDVAGTAAALHRALSMPAWERRERAQLLRRAVAGHDLVRWLGAELQPIHTIEVEERAVALAR